MLHWKTVFVISLCVTIVAAIARADTYPDRPVRIIVPYGPGGIADVTMRLVAQNLSKRLSQQFFIENRPGSSGSLGTSLVARSTDPSRLDAAYRRVKDMLLTLTPEVTEEDLAA